jgi:hypothetical protein
MTKPIFKTLSVLAFVVAVVGSSDAMAFGEEPYWPGIGREPAIESGCWRWNWQQHSWYEHCPVYVRPKAYMYPRLSRVALRTRG